jgi:hypothetical protein
MKQRRINYSRNGYISDMTVEIVLIDDVKIPESAINKALMIAMNYLIENMETEDQESAE